MTAAATLEFPGFSGQALASGFSRRGDAEVQAPGSREGSVDVRMIKAHRAQLSVQMMCPTLLCGRPDKRGLRGDRMNTSMSAPDSRRNNDES